MKMSSMSHDVKVITGQSRDDDDDDDDEYKIQQQRRRLSSGDICNALSTDCITLTSPTINCLMTDSREHCQLSVRPSVCLSLCVSV